MIVNNLGLVEAGLTFLIVVGFCVWQYVSVSRSQVRDRAKAEADKSAAAGHAEGQHPLHDRRDKAVE
jgi:hypothetical protein